jgi:transposase-like protein
MTIEVCGKAGTCVKLDYFSGNAPPCQVAPIFIHLDGRASRSQKFHFRISLKTHPNRPAATRQRHNPVLMSSSDMTPTASLPSPLPPAQAEVAAALAKGHTMTAAAQAAGVSRMTVYRWLSQQPFQAAVSRARSEYVLTLRDDLKELSVRALAALHAILDDPQTPAAVRLRAVTFILKRPQSPDPGWTLPESILSPKEDELLHEFALIEKDYHSLLRGQARDGRKPATTRHAS